MSRREGTTILKYMKYAIRVRVRDMVIHAPPPPAPPCFTAPAPLDQPRQTTAYSTNFMYTPGLYPLPPFLSSLSADQQGKPTTPSPFIDELELA
jgi:hypothetical protein